MNSKQAIRLYKLGKLPIIYTETSGTAFYAIGLPNNRRSRSFVSITSMLSALEKGEPLSEFIRDFDRDIRIRAGIGGRRWYEYSSHPPLEGPGPEKKVRDRA